MPLAKNKQQVFRKQTNVIDYSRTDDEGYTELAILEVPHNVRTVHTEAHTVYQQGTTKTRSCSKTQLLLVACVVIAIIATISASVLAALYVKEIDDKKNTPTSVGASSTPANRDDKKNISTTVGPSSTPANKGLIGWLFHRRRRRYLRCQTGQ